MLPGLAPPGFLIPLVSDLAKREEKVERGRNLQLSREPLHPLFGRPTRRLHEWNMHGADRFSQLWQHFEAAELYEVSSRDSVASNFGERCKAREAALIKICANSSCWHTQTRFLLLECAFVLVHGGGFTVQAQVRSNLSLCPLFPEAPLQ